MSFEDGAAAIVFGVSFFGFLASRFPRFFSEAMTNLQGSEAMMPRFDQLWHANLEADRKPPLTGREEEALE